MASFQHENCSEGNFFILIFYLDHVGLSNEKDMKDMKDMKYMKDMKVMKDSKDMKDEKDLFVFFTCKYD